MSSGSEPIDKRISRLNQALDEALSGVDAARQGRSAEELRGLLSALAKALAAANEAKEFAIALEFGEVYGDYFRKRYDLDNPRTVDGPVAGKEMKFASEFLKQGMEKIWPTGE